MVYSLKSLHPFILPHSSCARYPTIFLWPTESVYLQLHANFLFLLFASYYAIFHVQVFGLGLSHAVSSEEVWEYPTLCHTVLFISVPPLWTFLSSFSAFNLNLKILQSHFCQLYPVYSKQSLILKEGFEVIKIHTLPAVSATQHHSYM